MKRIKRKIPKTTERVAVHTPPHVNERIRRRTEERIAYYARHPDKIDRRLQELDREWDIERVLEANAATLALGGTLLGGLVNRRFLVLPGLVTGFLLQHAIQGWCPPVSIFRRRGVRTAAEISEEREALKMLRGDFAKPPGKGSSHRRAREALSRARM